MKSRLLFGLAFVLLATANISAQQGFPPEAQPIAIVQTEAADGLILMGEFHSPQTFTDSMPAVLLMHMLNGDRSDWAPLIPALQEAGFFVLTVDLRGHGQTGGRQDWDAAVGDVQAWLDWLRAQQRVRPDAVSIVGASIGSNLALIGCANDAQCATAVALSPGLNYYGLEPADAVADALRERSALLLASHRDAESAVAVETMLREARGEIGARIYAGAAHGTNLFRDDPDRVARLIVDWLVEHIPSEAEG
ncbi:MAG: alpha/beta fold hydrolase [bacterium]|nr:alpha/beta fold hydrolase [bacterium]